MFHLKKGDKAPVFKGMTDTMNEISLEDFKGKKVALYFYPKDSTPGCTNQACNIRDNNEILSTYNIQIIGVSPDSIKRHENFRKKHHFNFPLIADENKELLKAYGVWGEKKFMGRNYDGVHRTTFLIDEEGKITDIIRKVKTKDHSAQILEGFEIAQ